MSIVSSPLNFNDLKAASVYYEILDCNPANLQAICSEAQFEKKNDGTMAYYNVTANGSYMRADGSRGEFVKLTRSDGHEVFLHYSQVFGPTAAARRKMNTLAYVLGVTYQNTHRQMAMLNDLINEAAALNESMRKFDEIYYSFSSNALNYDGRFVNQVLQIEPDLLRLYYDNGLQPPLNRISTGALPQLYAKITNTVEQNDTRIKYNWEIFFVDNTGTNPTTRNLWANEVVYKEGVADPEPKSPPSYTVADCLGHPEISAIMDNPELTAKQFSSSDKYSLSSAGKSEFAGHFYAKCVWNGNNIVYNHLFGLTNPSNEIDFTRPYDMSLCNAAHNVNVSAVSYSRIATFEEVLREGKIGYISQKEANAFLDQIRIAIDQLNNKLSGISTMIGVHNQDLQQNYAVATATIEATEEAQQKTARNIH
jgi:hypothetical protein